MDEQKKNNAFKLEATNLSIAQNIAKVSKSILCCSFTIHSTGEVHVVWKGIDHLLFGTAAPPLHPQAGRGVIHFAIAPESDPYNLFSVDETGAVRVAGGLDREKNPAHTLLVWASDDGVPPRTATATLAVSTLKGIGGRTYFRGSRYFEWEQEGEHMFTLEGVSTLNESRMLLHRNRR